MLKLDNRPYSALVFITLLLSFSRGHTNETLQVINISPDYRLETLSPAGARQHVRLAGIKPFSADSAPVKILRKRLKTLLLGKSIQVMPLGPGVARVSYSGADIAERLLYEGIAELDPAGMNGIALPLQQKYIDAAESAFNARRGIWQQVPLYSRRFHHPLWAPGQLPQPMTSAPVFKP